MRTTVTLEPEIARKLRDLAHSRRSSFKAVLNEVLRRGLSAQAAAAARTAPFKVISHRGGFRPGLDPVKLNQFSDLIEVDDAVAECRRRS